MNTNNEQYNFQTLVPIDNVENLGVYKDALDFAFERKEIKNVAISGAYCAGKSSLLETYKRNCEEEKKKDEKECLSFLHISLAHFEAQHSAAQLDDTKRLSEPSTGQIEGRIINQLIHQIDASQIPLSKFRAKKETPRRKVISFSLLILIIGFLTLFLNEYSELSVKFGLIDSEWILVETVILVLCLLIDLVAIGICLYQLVNTLINKCTFKKLNIRGTEIEVFGDDKESFFDKHLDDVLYMIEKSKADAIVFEDIDRFDDNGIFEKLREINFLVNRKLEKDNRIVRFIYMIRDDIFSSKDRTKFFDFIIPVIPVIDGTNSCDQMAKKLKESKFIGIISESFLMSISLYVDDMRILNNIHNEFIIYFDRIQKIDPNPEKLFSIIAYKNLFPKDFGDLQLGRGYLHALFDAKEKIIKEEKIEMKSKITIAQEALQIINDEQLRDENELDVLYLLSPANGYLTVNGQCEDQFANRAAFMQAMKKNPTKIKCYHFRGAVDDFNLNQALIELMSKPNSDYSTRKIAIEEKYDIGISGRENEITDLQNQFKQIDKKTFSSLITRDNDVSIFQLTNDDKQKIYPDVQKSPYFPLIKNLVQRGKIDETYKDYLTYFYGEFISERDMIFCRSVFERKAKDFDYKIDHPEKVASLLEGYHFEQEELLNFCMARYLLIKPCAEKVHSYLQYFKKQIVEDKRLDFVLQFLDEATNKEKDRFIEEIVSKWPAIWNEISGTDIFSEEKKKDFLYSAICVLSKNRLLALNRPNSGLTKYISENRTFLSAVEPNVDKITEGLQTLDVRFKDIDLELAHVGLLKRVYEMNLYEINEKIIAALIAMFYGQNHRVKFWRHCYSILREKRNEPLFKYVISSKENKETFLSCVLQNCEEEIDDSEEAASEILSDVDFTKYTVVKTNEEKIELDYREQYMDYLHTIISKINTIADKRMWPLLLKNQNVAYSVENILTYFYDYSNEIDETLVTFINSSKEKLKFQYNDIKLKYNQKATNWFVQVFACHNLSDERYSMIARTAHCQYRKIEWHGIPSSRMDLLIDLDIITMTEANLEFVRAEYPENKIHFILKNIIEYTKNIITKENFDINELLELMKGSKVSDKYLQKLLSNTVIPISVKDFKCSDKIEQIVIKHNYDEIDLAYFISNYEKKNKSLKDLINNLCMKNMQFIIKNKIRMGMPLLLLLLGSEGVSTSDKVDLFGLNSIGMQFCDVKGCLEILGKDDIILLFTKRSGVVEASGENTRLLAHLYTAHLIGKYEMDNRLSGYFRVYSLKKYRTIN